MKNDVDYLMSLSGMCTSYNPKPKLTPRQEATLVGFKRVLEDTGIEIEYNNLDVWVDDGMENGVYGAKDLLEMIMVHVRKYDEKHDHEVEMIIQAFDIEIGWDEAESALDDQGDVDSAIIELRKLRG